MYIVICMSSATRRKTAKALKFNQGSFNPLFFDEDNKTQIRVQDIYMAEK